MHAVPRASLLVVLLLAQLATRLPVAAPPTGHCERHDMAAHEVPTGAHHDHEGRGTAMTHVAAGPSGECDHCPPSQCATHQACMVVSLSLAEPTLAPPAVPTIREVVMTRLAEPSSTSAPPPTRPPLRSS